MRLEATVPDSRVHAATALADELGLSQSQLVDEALALFLRAAAAVRQGRRLLTVDARNPEQVQEVATPTLSALEWAANPQPLDLPPASLAKMMELVNAPPPPNERLRAAVKRYRQ